MGIRPENLIAQTIFGQLTVCKSNDGRDWLALEPENYAAILRMLIKRATLWDRWRAMHNTNHWLNRAKIEIDVFGKSGRITWYKGH